MTTQKRLKKYSREKTENLPNRRINERSLKIIETIHRYNFLPSSLIVRLIEGNHRITKRHLQNLYHQGFINRFAFPTIGFPSEFIYYIDDVRALKLLVNHGYESETIDFELVRRNKEKNYHLITKAKHTAELQGHFLFLAHELMISRFHYLLEMACRKSKGKVKLLGFFQGTKIWNRTTAPKVSIDKDGYLRELEETEKLPHRPDAFFALHFPEREGEKTDYYFYEADRKTTNITKHNRKLRSHFYYIVKHKQHIEDYGVKRIKGVLIESIKGDWANHLRRGARHPLVSGSKPSPLFYFTTSEFFEQKKDQLIEGQKKEIDRFLDEPEMIFQRIWASPLDDDDNPNFKSLIED